LKSQWTQLGYLTALLAGGAALVFISVVSYIVLDEGDQTYWSRLYLARAQISAIETAVESFHKAYGRYPADLQELVHPARDGDSDEPFLSKIPPNPWGGPFRYQIERGPTDEGVKIWVIPDSKTQDKLRIYELSNKTRWQAVLKQ